MPPKAAKSSPEDDGFVTMSMLTQLLDQQKEFYKDMLQQQQENFKSFIQIIMDGNTKRLDGVIREVQELKTSLQFTQGMMDELKASNQVIDSRIKTFESTMEIIRQEMDAVSNKLDYMENQSRRSNLLIDGIPEEKGETSVGLEMKIQQMLAKNLDLDVSNIDC